MEVRHRQQLGLPGRQPLGTGLPLALRTMPVPLTIDIQLPVDVLSS
jgi:hypothetical protein